MEFKTQIWVMLGVALVWCAGLSASDDNYGLYFNSHQVPGQKRTSLLLDEGKHYEVKDEFTIDFQMFLRPNEPGFGSVLHLTTNENQVIHFIFMADEAGKVCPGLVYNEGLTIFHTPLQWNKWVPVSLHLNVPKNLLKLSYAGNDSVFVIPLRGTTGLKIQFGKVENYMSDVVPMNVKDIHLLLDRKEVRYWKLWKHNGDVCLDEHIQASARAEFPSWLIDNHVEWKKLYFTAVNGTLDVAFNARNAHFYIVRPGEVEELDEHALPVKKYQVKRGQPLTKASGHCLYDTLTNQLISYSLATGKTSRFFFETSEWSEEEAQKEDLRHCNHARAFRAADSAFYFFGGYGLYRYQNDLFRWKSGCDTLQKILYENPVDPRFASAMAIVDDNIYILGGRGNKLGRQAVESYFYFDLWQINLSSKKAKLLWKKKEVSAMRGLLLASSMYFSAQDSAFYALNMDDGGGRLLKFSMRDTVWSSASHPIGNRSEYQDFNYSLYNAPAYNKCYLVVDKILSSGDHQVSIYSIDTPLLGDGEIMQTLAEEGSSRKGYLYGLVLLFLLVGGLVLWRKKQRKRSEKKQVPANPVEVEMMEEESLKEKKRMLRDHSAISLLGTFSVRDKEGNDITFAFTSKLKELLILLIMYSEEEERGILTKKIADLLWEDKDESAARNNRNVTVRKLRVLLESVGDVEVITDNGFMRIEWGKEVFCDYHVIKTYVKAFQGNRPPEDEESLNRILELLLCGPLLSNTIVGWLDKFKDAYSSLSIDLFGSLLNMESVKQHPDMLLRLADIMFLHDPLNEEALAIKCSVFSAQGKRGIAKSIYDRFCKEYEDLLAENYKVPFSDLEH